MISDNQTQEIELEWYEDSTVYLIYDSISGLTKIGVSHDPGHRITQLRNKENELTIIAEYPGGFLCEQTLHGVFKSKRKTGEFFLLSIDDISEIDRFFNANLACASLAKTWAASKTLATQYLDIMTAINNINLIEAQLKQVDSLDMSEEKKASQKSILQIKVNVAKMLLEQKHYLGRIQRMAKIRASKLAETENIILHDEYLRETRPEMMGEYVNS